jgi:hypothetical protein
MARDVEKQRATRRAYYERHRERLRPINQERQRRKRRKLKALVDAAKASGCIKCPEKDLRCLDLHHRDPAEKSFGFGEQMYGVSVARLEAEIAKCDVLCANCHRKEH